MAAGKLGDPDGGAGFWEENKSKPLLSFCVVYFLSKSGFNLGLRKSILSFASDFDIIGAIRRRGYIYE